MKMPELSYPYRFAPSEGKAIKNCVDEHGFAVVEGIISDDLVDELKQDVRRQLDPQGEMLTSKTHRVCMNFSEHSTGMTRLLEHERFLDVYREVLGAQEMTIHRSAAIIRPPGIGPVDWHTDDHKCRNQTPNCANAILNNHDYPNGAWFYLNGSHPARGGLAVIADSHVPDWPGPEGFSLTADRGSFYPQGAEPRAYSGMDVPGVVPLFTAPNDFIFFAARTYHAAFPHGGDALRLSCALCFRPRDVSWSAPWPLSKTAQDFVSGLPAHLRPFVDGYTGIDTGWRPAA